MNPIYRFIMPGLSNNLLNPITVTSFDSGNNQTDFIEVVEGKTYELRNNHNETLAMIKVFLYDDSKTQISVVDLPLDIEIPTGIKYIRVVFRKILNPNKLGVFQLPLLNYEPFSKNYVHPIYKSDLGLDYALESNQEFYRGKLSGKLTFQMDDYKIINTAAFDTQFDLHIYISYDMGQTWTLYWMGQFWKTDCEFNDDDKTAIVTPNVNDAYNAVLAGLDKEFNLIDLAPVIQPVKMDKRSLIQVYVPGEKVIGCFLSNMWWEQECEVITNESQLVNHYHFQKQMGREIVVVSGAMTPQLPLSFSGPIPNRTGEYGYSFTNGDYQLLFDISDVGGSYNTKWEISRLSDGVVLWHNESIGPEPTEPNVPYTIVLTPVSGSGATGNVSLSYYDLSVYARRISDITNGTYPIPDDDLVIDNRNYTRVSPVDVSDQIILSSVLSNKPTEWGIYQPGSYYVMPYDATFGPTRCYPIARSMWSEISFWFAVSQVDWQTEYLWRSEFTLKDAFPLYSVISVLLGKIAPGITHDGTTDYSEFLYGGRPWDIPNFRLFITPKSNVITSGYDQPAQNAPITLKRVLDMLRDCYRLYWFIDANNRFRIEHIEYFRRGGTYTGEPIIGTDLTQEVVTRNGKPWAYARKQYKFDKPEMTAWYQFGWMDNETELFNGNPLEIVSKYVNPDKIETIEISQFSADIDYMLLTPADISQDGFALLAPVVSGNDYKLPYFTFTINHVDYELQNAYAAFVYTQLFYRYDMPGRQYKRNGVQETAIGVKKLKTQSIKFPMLYDPDLTKLIKTTLGNGTIQKLTINLSSRNANATLKYDTE